MSSTIAVIGAGNIGGTLARKWAEAGHRVLLGVRDPASPKARAAVAACGDAATATSIPEAAAEASVVVFALPGSAMAASVHGLRPALAGKVVIDATNTIGPAGPVNNLEPLLAEAPSAIAYRAFNSLGWENVADPVIDGTAADLFFAGPDGATRAEVERSIREVGLRPIWLGGPERTGLVDAVAAIWFALVLGQGKSRRLGFRVLGL